ncbi:DUF1127 domain-containing protein [Faunimonas sp. B44]|uniref:DUF1127 domain-containing protein n=1 Tax=Faunimonas sp. B44 TaxID=3461493 RepID=UPI0040444861
MQRNARGALHSLAVALLERLSEMAERRRTRRALLALTDDQLKDIGISRADAYREGLRRFWD